MAKLALCTRGKSWFCFCFTPKLGRDWQYSCSACYCLAHLEVVQLVGGCWMCFPSKYFGISTPSGGTSLCRLRACTQHTRLLFQERTSIIRRSSGIPLPMHGAEAPAYYLVLVDRYFGLLDLHHAYESRCLFLFVCVTRYRSPATRSSTSQHLRLPLRQPFEILTRAKDTPEQERCFPPG